MNVLLVAIKNLFGVALVFSILLCVTGHSNAGVSIVRGETPIPAGNAKSDQDITVINEKLAFSIAVDSAPPWGVARGCIVDIANVLADGSLSNDRVAFADFIPNDWSSWPTTYQKVEVVKNQADEVVIRSMRDFGEVDIETLYSLKANSDFIHVKTTMKNNGKDLVDLISGFTLWPDAGFKFSVPGYAGMDQAKVDQPISDRFVGYGADWNIALHAPYVTEFKNKSRDLYTRHTLKQSASVTFEGYYQVSSDPSLAAVVKREIELKGLEFGSLYGEISAVDSIPMEAPAIVISKMGVPYAWVIGVDGRYQVDLPIGDYEVYASGEGYSDSNKNQVSIKPGKKNKLSFDGLRPPGIVNVSVAEAGSNKPLDAKIQIEKGNKPLIEYFGAKTFFTQLNKKGEARFKMAPGKYQLRISSGENFLTNANYIDVNVDPGESVTVESKLTLLSNPVNRGWYAGDMHHHADVLEGSTPPEYVVRSQLAAGLNVTFISDHDSSKNHQEMQTLSDSRDILFIPSMEISPSWGHFNVYPIELGAKLSVDSGVDDIHQILADARKMGAIVVASNHPYIPYGYLSSLEKGTAPGGFNPSIDLFEINSEVDNDKIIKKARELWSENLPYYYTAGSDTHDVWNETTGHNRLFVYTGGKPSAKSYAQAMKNGHSYVSFGPIIYPHKVKFGDTLKLAQGQSQKLVFDLLSVNGLKSVQLIDREGVRKNLALNGQQQTVSFDVPFTNGWLALVVEDSKENKAYSNPIWLKTVDKDQL